MALVGSLIGLPMFFEIGLVLLMPVIFLVSRRSGLSLLSVGIPALAGLSVMHGLVPPHPGPLVAIDALGADLGATLALGVLIAIPTAVVAGPVFGRYAARWVDVPAPEGMFSGERDEGRRRPSFPVTLATVLLPVGLMMSKALADIVINDEEDPVQRVFDLIGPRWSRCCSPRSSPSAPCAGRRDGPFRDDQDGGTVAAPDRRDS